MGDPRRPQLPSFEVGESLFLFEPGQVRVLGQDGSEAVIPVADFEAFIEHLAQLFLPAEAGE